MTAQSSGVGSGEGGLVEATTQCSRGARRAWSDRATVRPAFMGLGRARAHRATVRASTWWRERVWALRSLDAFCFLVRALARARVWDFGNLLDSPFDDARRARCSRGAVGRGRDARRSVSSAGRVGRSARRRVARAHERQRSGTARRAEHRSTRRSRDVALEGHDRVRVRLPTDRAARAAHAHVPARRSVERARAPRGDRHARRDAGRRDRRDRRRARFTRRDVRLGRQAWIVPSAEAFPSTARFWALTPYFFLGMPFVAADPGTHYERLADAELDGVMHRLVKLTYEDGTGDAPDDYYVLYLHPDTHRLTALRYVVSYPGFFAPGAHSPEKLMRFTEPTTAAGLLLATRLDTYAWSVRARRSPRSVSRESRWASRGRTRSSRVPKARRSRRSRLHPRNERRGESIGAIGGTTDGDTNRSAARTATRIDRRRRGTPFMNRRSSA